ncbi:TlpA family protein disulfide reductase [Cohnella nanjingensis]|uniref:TlpA family protein disulfide reductase n=1 Tax=Cohnella nanjingensis TaxID=1387779 RepID=A0A7X0RT74_9BACL|nr:TlpA disulfide reductase family protein [Cohnella nanjingensis]MBB6673242.1 TlpA family protein disulfide reductase [Cohnella nanjingensis]
MNKVKTWLVLILVAGTAAFALYHAFAGGEAAARPRANPAAALKEAPEIDALAPGFNLHGMDGRSYTLSQFKGKPVILNFWASWCGPCQDEAPSLARLYARHKDDLQILAVNLTAADNESDARKFVKDHGFAFPVLLDEDGKTGRRYRIRPIPTTFFIDARGVIVDGVLGALSAEALNNRAEQLLKTHG